VHRILRYGLGVRSGVAGEGLVLLVIRRNNKESCMKWLWTGIVIVAAFCGCKSDLVEKDLGLRMPSPSRKYILAVNESTRPNEPPQISLGLRDAAGNALDVARTDVAANRKWAVGWAPGEDVIVLCSGNGTSVYFISKKDEKLRLMECPQPKYGNVGLELMRLKYESSKEEAKPGGETLRR
jgi:hypothetical protein